jgi:hypothetical protein
LTALFQKCPNLRTSNHGIWSEKVDAQAIKKSSFVIIATVLLGALGSGFWEVALRPFLAWSASILLDVATLGLTTLRDGIYVDVAKGSYERASLMTLSVLFGLLSGVVTVVGLGILWPPKTPPTTEKAKRSKWLPFLAALAITIFFIIQSVRVTYIIRASNYLSQLERIVAPFVTDNQMKTFASRVASIRSRADFVAVSKEMEQIVKSKNVQPPEFSAY